MILDNDISSKTTFYNVLQRWENKRMSYNAFLILIILVMYGIEYRIGAQPQSYWLAYWSDVFFSLIIANVVFSGVYLIEGWIKTKNNHYLSLIVIERMYNVGLWFSIAIVVLTGILSIIIYQ